MPRVSQRRPEVMTRAQAGRPGHAQQAARHFDVFHQRLRGKAAHAGKGGARHEHRLVAGGDAAIARAQVHAGRYHAQGTRAAGDAYVKTAPGRPRGQRLGYQPVGIVRQQRVRVQKKQRVARSQLRTGVHLQGPAARRLNDLHAAGPCHGHRVIAAAAVGHNDLGAARAQRRQRLQRGAQAGRLIKGRHDDAKVARQGGCVR